MIFIQLLTRFETKTLLFASLYLTLARIQAYLLLINKHVKEFNLAYTIIYICIYMYTSKEKLYRNDN